MSEVRERGVDRGCLVKTYLPHPTQTERAEAVRLWRVAVKAVDAIDPKDEIAVARVRWVAQGLRIECRNLGVSFAELDAAGGVS